MKKYVAIFWDWNGTLVDDLQYNIDCINFVIDKRRYERIDKERYFKTFGFPIVDFYKKLGFDFDRDPYEEVAEEYIEKYNAGADDIPLRKGVKEALAVYADKGIRQYILTASEKKIVEHGIRVRGIENYFTDVLGLDNYLARGKTTVGKKYLEQNPLEGDAVLIGDTEHDKEVAKELGMDCVLVKGGHSSDEKLAGIGVPVVDEVNQTYRYVLPSGRGFGRTFCDTAFISKYKSFYDDLKNTNKTEDW